MNPDMARAPNAAATIGGIPFVLTGEPPSPDELNLLQRLAAASAPVHPAGESTFTVELTKAPPWRGIDIDEFPDHGPATITCEGHAVRLTHRRFVAEIDAEAASARFFRTDPTAAPLMALLRIAISLRLPGMGALPLHAAGVDVDGRGAAFFGISGAGKSTIASRSPHPVLSDELVAVSPQPPRIWATGFWAEAGARPHATVPLVALFELAKGPAFSIEPLPPRHAARTLLPALLIPARAPSWRAALPVLERLVHTVPVYRLTWSLRDEPWPRLEAHLTRCTGFAQTPDP